MPPQQHLSPPILDAWAVFNLHCKAQRYRAKTLQFYQEKLYPFLIWTVSNGATHLDHISTADVRLYLVEKQTIYKDTPQEREASGHTVHGAARALRAFFNFCIAEQWLETSPMATVKMPRRPKRILDAYTQSEIKSLFKTVQSDRDRLLLYLLLDTGIRAAECTGIAAQDVAMSTNSILIRGGKGEKDRTVYFGAKTARLMIRHVRNIKPKQPLFSNQLTGSRLTYSGLAQLLRRIGALAGVYCTAHKFRRTFAITSLRNGMNVYLLAKLMGHEDIAQLKPYLDLLEVDSQAGQIAYGVVDNL